MKSTDAMDQVGIFRSLKEGDWVGLKTQTATKDAYYFVEGYIKQIDRYRIGLKATRTYIYDRNSQGDELKVELSVPERTFWWSFDKELPKGGAIQPLNDYMDRETEAAIIRFKIDLALDDHDQTEFMRLTNRLKKLEREILPI